MPDRLTFNLLRITLAALALCAGPAGAQDKIDLRLRLKKGEVYRLRLTVEQHIVQTPAPPASEPGRRRRAPQETPAQQPQAIDQTLALGYTMSVDDVDDAGAMTIATKYDAVMFRQKGPGGVTEYDSTNPPKQVPGSARAFAILPGLGFRMTVTPGGEVKSVEGLNEMLAEMVRRLELPAGPARESMQKQLAEQFGEAAMKQNMQNLFAIYPPGPVATGETWARKLVVSKGMPLVIDGKFTLKARTDGAAEVAIDAAISPNAEAGPVEMGSGKMAYELSGRQLGSATLDEATGWTRSMTTEQTVAGTLHFDTPGDRDTAIPISVKSKVVVEPAAPK